MIEKLKILVEATGVIVLALFVASALISTLGPLFDIIVK